MRFLYEKWIDFSTDLLLNFRKAFELCLGAILDEKTIKNHWKLKGVLSDFLIDFVKY